MAEDLDLLGFAEYAARRYRPEYGNRAPHRTGLKNVSVAGSHCVCFRFVCSEERHCIGFIGSGFLLAVAVDGTSGHLNRFEELLRGGLKHEFPTRVGRDNAAVLHVGTACETCPNLRPGSRKAFNTAPKHPPVVFPTNMDISHLELDIFQHFFDEILRARESK